MPRLLGRGGGRTMKKRRFLGYKVVETELGPEVLAPCGCGEHPEKSTWGHPFCSMPPRELVEAEERGEVYRMYCSLPGELYSRWRWFLRRCDEE